jgi:transcriptional regulator with XRE-family HTH domain
MGEKSNIKSIADLGNLIKIQREHKKISQEELAKRSGKTVNRSNIAHLEQGLRIPAYEVLVLICKQLEIPETYWQFIGDDKTQKRFLFESVLSELVGIPVSLEGHDDTVVTTVEDQIWDLFNTQLTTDQTFHNLSRIFVFYDLHVMRREFFDKYLTANAFKTIESMESAVSKYQR